MKSTHKKEAAVASCSNSPHNSLGREGHLQEEGLSSAPVLELEGVVQDPVVFPKRCTGQEGPHSHVFSHAPQPLSTSNFSIVRSFLCYLHPCFRVT